MSKTKLSYIIHAVCWATLWIAALFSKFAAQLYIYFVIAVGGLSYQLVHFLAAKPHPNPHPYGLKTIIPEIAWQLYGVFLLLIAIIILYVVYHKWRRGQYLPLIILGHVLLLLAGFIINSLVGSINYPFSL